MSNNVSWFCWDDTNDGKTSNGRQKTKSSSMILAAVPASKQQNSRYDYDSAGAAGDHVNINVHNQQAANKTNRTFDYTNSYPRSAPSTYYQQEEYHHQHSARSPPTYYQWPAPTPAPLTTFNQAQNTYDASFWHREEIHPTSSGDFADYSYHSRQQQQQQHMSVSRTSTLYSHSCWDKVEEEEPKRKLKKSKGIVADDDPRRPLSAYNFFFSEEKKIVVALLPDKTKKLEENFTDPDDTDAQVSDMNVDKIQEYLIEAKCNLSSEALAILRETVESQTERTLLAHLNGDKPKKSHKQSHGKISFQKLAGVIGMRWRDLSDDDKKRYFALAKVDHDRFKKQMEQLEERMASASSTTRSSGY